ncbi:MAG TPA: tail fiber protein [Bryobacteraceae bacterium]|jgi:microcystin-dependent protein
MSDQFVAEVRCVGFNFAPKDWAVCNGQILPLSQNTALFSLLGTYYGGNGTSNFALPNLQANVAMGQGNGAGLTPRVIGETGGTSSVTLLQTEMPAHNHRYMIDFGDGPAASGTPNAQAAVSFGAPAFANVTTPLTAFATNALAFTGGNQPHNNMMPYLTLNFVIALVGIYPPRS